MPRPKRKASVDGPTDVSVILDRILGGVALSAGLEEATIVARWPELVGDAVAKHVSLVRVEDGILCLHCDSAAWKAEVNWSKKAILDRSNSALGKVFARDVRFV